MNVLLTLDDLATDKASCATCTRKGGHCPRTEKRFPNGYLKSSVGNEISGIINYCNNYTGKYKLTK